MELRDAGKLCRDPFDGQMMHVGAFTRVLESNCGHIPLGIQVEDRVIVEVLRLGDLVLSKGDV